MTEASPLPQLVLCVPGPWEDRSQFLKLLIERTQGAYLFAGQILMHVETNKAFTLEFESRDERMSGAFAAAGHHWRDSEAMHLIDAHRSVAYLLGSGESEKEIAALMLAAQALLDAGGLGVKVENTGVAHSPDSWKTMCSGLHLFSPYKGFVIVVTSSDEAYSCGMHCFGLHDVQVIDADGESALQVARTFSWYLYTERPSISAGQTFACDEHAPAYRISTGEGVDYEPDSMFKNPYGTWKLQRC